MVWNLTILGFDFHMNLLCIKPFVSLTFSYQNMNPFFVSKKLKIHWKIDWFKNKMIRKGGNLWFGYKSMAWLVLKGFWVECKHLGVVWSDDTVETLFLIWGHFGGSIVWDELHGFVNCLWRGQECHQILNWSGWSWRGANSVQEQFSHCFLIKIGFFLFLLFELWVNVNRVVKVGLDVGKWETGSEKEEDESSSQLNKKKVTLPSDLASLKILSVIFPTLLAFIIPISSWLNLRLPRLVIKFKSTSKLLLIRLLCWRSYTTFFIDYNYYLI